MGRAKLLQQVGLAVLSHDINEADTILLADARQHLTKV